MTSFNSNCKQFFDKRHRNYIQLQNQVPNSTLNCGPSRKTMKKSANKSTPSNFYIKIAYKNKIRKYLVKNFNEIRFTQIKQNFGLEEKWKNQKYGFEIVEMFNLVHNNQTNYHSVVCSEEQLLQQLKSIQINNKSIVKLRIVQKTLMSQEEKRRKESYQSEQLVPDFLTHRKSKSVEQKDIFDIGCQTQVFELTQGSIFTESVYTKLSFNRPTISTQCTLTDPSRFPKNKISQSLYIPTSPIIDKQNRRICLNSSQMLNCLHQSLYITRKQKTQLQIIEENIMKKRKQLKVQEKQQNLNNLFDMLNF